MGPNVRESLRLVTTMNNDLPSSSPQPSSPRKAIVETGSPTPTAAYISPKSTSLSSPIADAKKEDGEEDMSLHIPVLTMSKEDDDGNNSNNDDEQEEEKEEEYAVNYDEDDEFGEEEDWCGDSSSKRNDFVSAMEDNNPVVTTTISAESDMTTENDIPNDQNDDDDDDRAGDDAAEISMGGTKVVEEDDKVVGEDKFVTDTVEDVITTTAAKKTTLEETKETRPSQLLMENNEGSFGAEQFTDVAVTPVAQDNTIMELNVAYESLETIRRANLEIELGKSPSSLSFDLDDCTQCLRIAAAEPPSLQPPQRKRRGWLRRRTDSTSSSSSYTSKPSPPCLICGCPVCSKHACSNFKKSKITICSDCSPLLSADYVTNQLYEDAMAAAAIFVDSIGSDASSTFLLTNRNYIRLLDVYDRSFLVLKYSTQFINDIVVSLNQNQKRTNRIGLGSSATNFVGGVTGVVGAATIFTPVGPPLLLASLLFGGGATAVSAGTDRVNYRSEARQLADRILVLFDVVLSLKEGMERVFGTQQSNRSRRARINSDTNSDNDDKDSSNGAGNTGISSDNNNGSDKEEDRESKEAISEEIEDEDSGSNEKTATSSKIQTRSLTKQRVTTNVTKSIPVVGSVVSVFTIAMETREMASTVKKIRAGDPCEKAQALEEILIEMEKMPKADELEKRCEEYMASVQQVADCDDDDCAEDFGEGYHEDYYDGDESNVDGGKHSEGGQKKIEEEESESGAKEEEMEGKDRAGKEEKNEKNAEKTEE